jgi:hypothetical protein
VVLTTKEPSLEDEIAIRQNISKKLASNKMEEEKKNVLAEKPNTTTLTVVEPIELEDKREFKINKVLKND